MRSMDPLDNGIFEKGIAQLTKELRLFNQLSLMSLAWDMDLLRRKDVQKLLSEMSYGRISLIKERYDEKEVAEKLEESRKEVAEKLEEIRKEQMTK